MFHARVWNRNRKTVFWISVLTDSGFCLTSFISQCILLSELVGWGEEAENNNPVHILLAPVLFAFSAASLRLVGSACTHLGHRPTTTCLWQTFLLFPFFFFFLIILGDDLVYQTLYQTWKNKCNNQAISTWSVSMCGKQKVFSWCSLAWPSKSKKKKHFKKTEETLEEIEKYIKSLY